MVRDLEAGTADLLITGNDPHGCGVFPEDFGLPHCRCYSQHPWRVPSFISQFELLPYLLSYSPKRFLSSKNRRISGELSFLKQPIPLFLQKYETIAAKWSKDRIQSGKYNIFIRISLRQLQFFVQSIIIQNIDYTEGSVPEGGRYGAKPANHAKTLFRRRWIARIYLSWLP